MEMDGDGDGDRHGDGPEQDSTWVAAAGAAVGQVPAGTQAEAPLALHRAPGAGGAANAQRGKSPGRPAATNSHLDARKACTAWKILIVAFWFAF